MLFNSIEFVCFFLVAFTVYWYLLKDHLKLQNVFLVIASYIFYGWWDWRFLFLIFLSSLIDYFIGIKIYETTVLKIKKRYLIVSMVANLGILAFFKYFNFFIDSVKESFSFFGYPLSIAHLNIVLPVGISFYTFQTLSYSIDVYRNKLKPTKDFIIFSAFVSFFPQLVAGPIERATHLLPQFMVKRKFDYALAVQGVKQMVWGFFKKIVIADSCGFYVDDIFANFHSYSGGTLFLGMILFSFQIYADFSGYSDIAIGLSKLFGFDLMTNFRKPYFSRDVSEFWRRWHISLSTWFRDYLYIPLGGSKGSAFRKVRNIFIIFIVSGFWHGNNWTFVVWGFLNALFFLPLLLQKKNRRYVDEISRDKFFPSFKEGIRMIITFLLISVTWVFFRSNTIIEAFQYLKRMVLNFSLSVGSQTTYTKSILPLLGYLGVFILIEWSYRNDDVVFNRFYKNSLIIKNLIYFSVILFILLSVKNGSYSFIYFQF